MNNQSFECCPQFDPTPWNGALFKWHHKRFIKDRAITFMYIPINFGSAMARMNRKVEHANATMPDYLCLSEHVSPWRMNFFLAVSKEIPDADNVEMSGKFLSKVYEGNFQDTEKWVKDFQSYAKEKQLIVEQLYMWYTTCPKCAKKYGKNYVVIIAKV